MMVRVVTAGAPSCVCTGQGSISWRPEVPSAYQQALQCVVLQYVL